MRAATFQRRRRVSGRIVWILLSVLLMSRAPMAEAQTTLGGHIGFVLPFVTMPQAQRPTLQITFPLVFRSELPSREKAVWHTISNWFLECRVLRGKLILPCIRVLFGTWDTTSVLGYEQRLTLILRNGDSRRW